jgi:predicted ABC-type ATPase
MRVFAGPNGSGKSTIIKAVRDYRTNKAPLDFGIYINADDIADALRKNTFSFNSYEITTIRNEFKTTAMASGLVKHPFNETVFDKCYTFNKNKIHLLEPKADERLAQIVADFLRKKLLSEKKKFSFETVFSHSSKLDIMKQAKSAGYKVYLYFVSTESPEINIDRVAYRKETGGHDVPLDKIRGRYYRSLDLLHAAAQIAYQAYFFDNSGRQPELIAHFKNEKGRKRWDPLNPYTLPVWFQHYYLGKVEGS